MKTNRLDGSSSGDDDRSEPEFPPGVDSDLLRAVGDAFSNEPTVGWQEYATPKGISVIPGQDPFLAVSSASRTGLEVAELLSDAIRYGSILERKEAHVAISNVIHALVEPYRGRVAPRPGVFARFGGIEDQLGRVKAWIPKAQWGRAFFRTWTMLGFIITVLAAYEILHGHFLIAAGIITGRCLVSSTMATPGFVGDRSEGKRTYVAWRACAVGQFADAVVLGAVGGYLLTSGHHVWGIVTGVVPLLALGATLLRLAASQGGVVLGRMHLERVARSGALVIGLLGAGLAGSHHQTILIASLCLAVAGAAAFAVVEVVRTIVYTSSRVELDRTCGPYEAFAKRIADVAHVIDAAVESESENFESEPHAVA